MKKNVLITGASSGIGRETALIFAKNGYNTTIVCRSNKDALTDLNNKILSFGGTSFAFLKDVSQFNEVESLFDELKKVNFLPDIIINNAGISYVGLLQDMTGDDWRRIIDTNLSSAFYCSKLAIPHMINKKSGRIINISSMWGNAGASCEVAYSASKGGLNTFTKALAKELAPSGISVNAIAFGAVDTRMNSFLSNEEKKELINEIPAGYMLSAKDAAKIVYSVANLDSYVTGQIIGADGGFI